jgi:hypothetical protein
MLGDVELVEGDLGVGIGDVTSGESVKASGAKPAGEAVA